MCATTAPVLGTANNALCSEQPFSRELLRSACEPFFDQMLNTLQLALQEQRILPSQIPETINMMMDSMMAAMCASCQQAFVAPPMPMYCTSQPFQMFDEASTEADESGAFSALLSGSSSPSAVEVGVEPTFASTLDDSDPASDPEKTVMVCRHWRSKGWCRMEDKCKFLHPENKRGVAAPSDVPTADGEIALAVTKRKKRGGKGRNRAQNTMEQQCFGQTSIQA